MNEALTIILKMFHGAGMTVGREMSAVWNLKLFVFHRRGVYFTGVAFNIIREAKSPMGCRLKAGRVTPWRPGREYCPGREKKGMGRLPGVSKNQCERHVSRHKIKLSKIPYIWPPSYSMQNKDG